MGLHGLLDVGVDRGRAGAFELAELADDVGRERDAQLRKSLAGDLLDRLLVLRIGIGMQQADGDRGDAGRGQRLKRMNRACVIKRLDHLAFGIDAFRHRHAVPPRHQRRVRPPVNVINVRLARGAADRQHVTEAVRRDQADIDIFLLNDDVGDERGAVDESFDVGMAELRFVQDFLDAVENTDAEILRRRRHLESPEDRRPGIEQDEIGVGTAGVDADLG
jgi:hypothetical protein